MVLISNVAALTLDRMKGVVQRTKVRQSWSTITTSLGELLYNTPTAHPHTVAAAKHSRLACVIHNITSYTLNCCSDIVVWVWKTSCSCKNNKSQIIMSKKNKKTKKNKKKKTQHGKNLVVITYEYRNSVRHSSTCRRDCIFKNMYKEKRRNAKWSDVVG